MFNSFKHWRPNWHFLKYEYGAELQCDCNPRITRGDFHPLHIVLYFEKKKKKIDVMRWHRSWFIMLSNISKLLMEKYWSVHLCSGLVSITEATNEKHPGLTALTPWSNALTHKQWLSVWKCPSQLCKSFPGQTCRFLQGYNNNTGQ